MNWRYVKTIAVAVATSAVLWTTTARADDPNAVLDLLERKGIITHEEAQEARKYYEQQQAAAVAKYDKPKFADWLSAVKFEGDARLRYEWRSGQLRGTSVDNSDLDRWRWRLRFGLEGTYREHYVYGLRLETATSNRSTNVTFGQNAQSAQAGSGNGPFSKVNNAISIGRLYVGWKPNDHFALIGGRQEIPFMNTSMVWDDDLNPEGAVEKIIFKTDKVDWFANFGQFIYADLLENDFSGKNVGLDEVYMLGWQVGAKVKIKQDVSVTVAPTLYHYVNANNFSNSGTNAASFKPTFFNGSTINNAINDLVVVDVPLELAFPLGKVPAKLFGDLAVNLTGSERAKANFDPTHDDQTLAYQIGLSIGNAKKKGDWLVKGYWQHQELYSLDPNLVDSDLFDSRLNMAGFVVQGSYYLTDFLFLKLSYANANDIKHDLPTVNNGGDIKGGTGNALHKYQLLQMDLNWKF